VQRAEPVWPRRVSRPVKYQAGARRFGRGPPRSCRVRGSVLGPGIRRILSIGMGAVRSVPWPWAAAIRILEGPMDEKRRERRVRGPRLRTALPLPRHSAWRPWSPTRLARVSPWGIYSTDTAAYAGRVRCSPLASASTSGSTSQRTWCLSRHGARGTSPRTSTPSCGLGKVPRIHHWEQVLRCIMA
jgi:hypothetical protein